MASFCESSEPGIGPSTGSADGRSLNVSSHGKKSVATRSEPPTGLLYVPDFVPEDEEAELLTGMERLEFHEIVMHDTPARRTTAHFGWDYGYESRDIHPSDPIPKFLVRLRARSAALIDAAPDDLAEVLLTRYPPGATIGWHRDAPMFGPSVVGVSLLGPCVMRFRRRAGQGFVRYDQPMEPRSAYILAGPARAIWQHSIPPVPGLRYSVTFRTLRTDKIGTR